MKEIVTLDLFGGMGTAMQALKNLGFSGKHFYSDIKTAAMKVATANFPDLINLGDVRKIRYANGILYGEFGEYTAPRIDIVTSGSPCKDLSGAGKRAGLTGKNSRLFFEFVRILQEVRAENPDVLFFQENVGSAPKSAILKISQVLGLLPVRMNSSLVTAQLRDRYYWSNIKTRTDWTGQVFTDFPEPEDRGLGLSDILTNGFTDREKARAILESESRADFRDVKKLYRRYAEKGFVNIVFNLNKEKNKWGAKTHTDNIYADGGKIHALLETNCARIKIAQCVQLNASKENGGRQPYQQNRIYADFGKMTAATESKSATLKTAQMIEASEIIIRVLNKTELLRLQGFPDNYADCLSRNQTASVVGDGWTLPMIEHFFSYIPKN